ncbi:hypothetical protein SAMN05216326_12725 [Nitrosomonas marina]|uniref:Gp5/Type VI secretion system Vgr protein OB-fold domain-containing protein n=1 Tax=Nitrosomonas marina TaxID=917 RepID=A0A1I0EGT6_9PROT|nr:hypothetical protein [Nitrosomonas marina]SET44266.1 hypothetical protein SAMN05216326_12725 [Nitrosomonas marina]
MMNEYGYMPGIYPGIVNSYNQERRTCRIEIPGLTDGGDVLPEAEIKYSIGDKSREGEFTTEIEILPGDTVWIEFIGGDSRYPVITGYRNPQAGNSIDWRRWHHKNIEAIADILINHLAGNDIRQKAGDDLQCQAGSNTFIMSGGNFNTQTGNRTEIKSNNRILIWSLNSQIVLKSATGLLII